MRCLIFLIILIISVHGEFQYLRDSRASVSTVCTSSTASNTFCASDGCGSNELILCLGPNFGVSVNCSAQYPYCNEATPGNAQCVESCGSDFSCTGEGIYPDPLDCKKFHFCQNVNNNLVSQSYSCQDRYVFDPDAATTNYCKYTNNFYCTLPKCGNSNQMKNVLFLYPFFPYNRQYVALCIPSSKPIVFKCQDGYVADLSKIPVTCNFKCTSPGLFANHDDSAKYFECYYNSNSQLVMRQGNCFPGYVFVKDRCVVKSTLAPITTSTSTQSTTLIPIQTESTTSNSAQTDSTTSSSSQFESTTPMPTQSETEPTTTPVTTQSEKELTIASVTTQSESELTTQECIKPPCN